MRIAQDARFRAEADAANLRWTCEDCALFDGRGACAHGYPTPRHRKERYEDPSVDLLFCKDFELGMTS